MTYIRLHGLQNTISGFMSFGQWFLLLLLSMPICLSLSVTTAQSAEQGIKVVNPWIRFIMPSLPAAGYFTLSNETNQTQTLIGASSPACGHIMMHRSVQENGIEKMVMVKSVPVPAHGSVAFSPGDYHLMCMSPTSAMSIGASVPVTLVFANGTRLSATFTVKGAMGNSE